MYSIASSRISIHASLAGGDHTIFPIILGVSISIHASLAGGDDRDGPAPDRRAISIHASLAGGDRQDRLGGSPARYFNPRLPRGRRPALGAKSHGKNNFNPRLPRGRRRGGIRRTRKGSDFNPRLPRGRRRAACSRLSRRRRYFNPRLPRGRRLTRHSMTMKQKNFNPRLPRGRRRDTIQVRKPNVLISIHASLAGGDHRVLRVFRWKGDFNPRLPRGRRHRLSTTLGCASTFQSTPPSREATRQRSCILVAHAISIHASLAGGDGDSRSRLDPSNHFNPRLPRGRRLIWG